MAAAFSHDQEQGAALRIASPDHGRKTSSGFDLAKQSRNLQICRQPLAAHARSGGVAFIRATGALDGVNAEGDQRFGVDIIRRAIEEPLRQISKNAGHEPSVVVDKVRGAFDGQHAELIHTNLSNEEEAKLREVFAEDD